MTQVKISKILHDAADHYLLANDTLWPSVRLADDGRPQRQGVHDAIIESLIANFGDGDNAVFACNQAIMVGMREIFGLEFRELNRTDEEFWFNSAAQEHRYSCLKLAAYMAEDQGV